MGAKKSRFNYFLLGEVLDKDAAFLWKVILVVLSEYTIGP